MENTKIKKEVIDIKKKDATIEEYKIKYGKIYQVHTTIEPDDETEVERTYIFKRPQMASYDRYVKTMSQSTTKATKVFVLDNIIEEQRELILQDLDEYPALSISIGTRLLEMLGLTKQLNLKTL